MPIVRYNIVPQVKSLGTEGINQCGSVQSSAARRYIVPLLLILMPGAHDTGTIGTAAATGTTAC